MDDQATVTAFGARLNPGVNMKVISEARQFFAEVYDINIYSYEFTTDTPVRPKENLPKVAFQNCMVCNKELYSFVGVEDGDDMRVMVRASSHFLFRDADGNRYPTCYKLTSCFKRFGFQPGDVPSGFITPPQFEDFHNLVDDDNSEDMRISVERLRESYEEEVYPFFLKWCNMPITKKNVMKFIKDLREVESQHLLFFGAPEAKRVVARKLLTSVGVENVR
jgi:hypothetical protein